MIHFPVTLSLKDDEINLICVINKRNKERHILAHWVKLMRSGDQENDVIVNFVFTDTDVIFGEAAATDSGW
jgi:hypothetical protein